MSELYILPGSFRVSRRADSSAFCGSYHGSLRRRDIDPAVKLQRHEYALFRFLPNEEPGGKVPAHRVHERWQKKPEGKDNAGRLEEESAAPPTFP